MKRLRPGAALLLKGSVLVSFFAASSAPSPLYGIYRAAWGFSALTLTVVFASYAIALLAALLVFGALSDHRGRREVVLLAIVLELVSVLLFLRADAVAWLLAARIVQGIATGIATAAVSAGLLDLHRERGSLVNSVAPMIGMAIGALGTSALVQFAPAPTRLVYLLLLVLLGLQFLASLFLPETVERRHGAWRSLRPSIAIPARARKTMWQVLPINATLWALGGFYLSLGPTLAKVITGNNTPLMGGALIATLVLGSALAIIVVRTRPPRLALMGGGAALAFGLAVTLAGMQAGLAVPFFIGTVFAGLGFGSCFNGAVRCLVPLAQAHERAGLMASFYVFSYLAFSLPAIAAGLSSGWVGLKPTALGFAAVLLALTLTSLVVMWRDKPPQP